MTTTMRNTTIALGIAVAVLAAATAFPDRPSRVASVDVERIFTALDEQSPSKLPSRRWAKRWLVRRTA